MNKLSEEEIIKECKNEIKEYTEIADFLDRGKTKEDCIKTAQAIERFIRFI